MAEEILIVGAAPTPDAGPFYRDLLGRSELVIACDAAAEWCIELGRVPEIAVGDFDSAAPGACERLVAVGVDVRRFPAEKDESDLDLALAVARSLSPARVILTAAYTARLDHTLAAIGTVSEAADLAASVEEPGFCAVVVSDRGLSTRVIDTVPGATVSVIALEESQRVTLAGLTYRLDDADLGLLSSLGLSNVADESRVRISLARGTLFVIASRSADEAIV